MKDSRFKRFIYILSFIATVVYIFYRIFYTIPSDSMITFVIAILVLLAEFFDAFFYGIYVFNILIYKKDAPPKANPKSKIYPEVDVFIATYNEDAELLEKTILACKEMDYPNKANVHIYLCDDGSRLEMKKLAEKLKIRYITRDNNNDAKAGNYNNALNHTKSPFIATFDADMKPNKDFLMKTVPYFMEDKNVGFVQLPQCFKDYDIFQSKLKVFHKIPFEQYYFYHHIQMAKNKTNSVVNCGTNVIFSRNALKKVGGFATKTITEDIATGLMIESCGYKAIALPEDEVYGETVHDIDSLLKQRSRWCRGCIQTYKSYIFGNHKLNLKQKLDYISAIYYWSFGVRTIFYLLVPLLFSIFDKRIIQGQVYLFFLLFFIQYILKRFIIDRLEKKHTSSAWNRIYETILAPIISIESIREIIGLGNKKFDVTSKKDVKKKKSWRVFYLYLCHLILFLLTLSGIIISLYKGFLLGFKHFIIPLFWLCSNLIYLGIALIFDCSVSTPKIDQNQENDASKYQHFSIGSIFTRFFKYEFHWKEILSGCVCCFFLFGFLYNDFYQVQRINYQLVSYNQQLQIKKGSLVNHLGEKISLRGVSSHNLYYFGDNYSYDNLKKLVKTWKINVFRVALYTDPNAEGYIKHPELLEKLEKIVDDCIDLDLYVVVDWHILEDNNPNIYKEEAIEFFDTVSKKYKDVPNVLYEICNEPNGNVSWDQDIKPYAEEVIQTIRKNSKDALVLVGTPKWSKDMKSVLENPITDDDKVMYVVHYYPGDEYARINYEMVSAIAEDIPMIVTETALTNATGDGALFESEFKDWISFLESNHISWIVWQFSDKNEACSLLVPKEKKWNEWIQSGKKTKKQLEKGTYDFNDYISESGKIVKETILEKVKK
ncbi:MAG: cellulase family glycosylhydrolase [Bacilli bacterium]|nr:cellulase family glycosylhydrolase [Bacilli bacterium]